MTQHPQGWGPQGGPSQGQPPQGPPPGYPPQGGYPPQNQPGGYPGGGYPPPGGYRPQGAYQPQPPYGPQPGYPPQGPPGYGPQGGGGGAGFGPGQPPKKKSPMTLILIVVAAVVLVAAIGGIFMALSNNDGDQPATSITPAQPTAPPSTDEPTDQPSGDPSQSAAPTDEPSPSEPSPSGSDQPSGDGVDLGNGIALTPASGWTVKKTGKGVAQLTDGESIFLGQAIKVAGSTNPGQLCTAWHKQVAEGTSGGKYADPKEIDLNSTKVKGATCTAQVTVSSGQGTANVFLYSLVSVRQSDGVTVLGTAYFAQNADAEKLGKDFETMVNSMLKTQT